MKRASEHAARVGVRVGASRRVRPALIETQSHGHVLCEMCAHCAVVRCVTRRCVRVTSSTGAAAKRLKGGRVFSLACDTQVSVPARRVFRFTVLIWDHV